MADHIFISHSTKDDPFVAELRAALELRGLTVWVDPRALAGSPEDKEAEANEAASLLLRLPWELLHDGRSYLFKGARPALVRRRLPVQRSIVLPKQRRNKRL